jgi:homoserine kinase
MKAPSLKVFAPASVANVAVGFDILGFALEKPGDEIIIREGTTPGLKITIITGAQNKLPYDVEKNTAGFAAMRFLEHIGETDRPLEMEIHKKMPFGSGLGSSAASAVAGVFAVNEMCRTGLGKYDILPFAVQGEELASGSYHADNVAPCMLGGVVLVRDNPSLDVKKLHVPSGLCVAVIYPHIEIMTKDARNMLSDTVAFKDVIKQTGNLGAFVASMYTSDFDLMQRSLQDVLVEPQRAKLIPHFYALKEMAQSEGCLGFSISGAGPSMFALCQNSNIAERIAEKGAALLTSHKMKSNVYVSKINHEGVFLC